MAEGGRFARKARIDHKKLPQGSLAEGGRFELPRQVAPA